MSPRLRFVSGGYAFMADTAGTTTNAFYSLTSGTATFAYNADMLDGLHAHQFIQSNQDVTITGTLTVSGNVGIGTKEPQTKLDVQGNQKIYSDGFGDSAFILSKADSGVWWSKYWQHIRRARGTHASPADVLNGDAIGGILFSGYKGDGYKSGASIYSAVKGTPGTTFVPGDLQLSTTDTSGNHQVRLYLDSSGNVGIGTTEPETKLDVNGVLEVGSGGRGAQLSSTVDDNFQLKTYNNTPNPNIWIGYGNGTGGLDETKEYIFMNGGKFMLMNGNVGIGTAEPKAKLDVNGTGRFTDTLYLATSDNKDILRFDDTLGIVKKGFSEFGIYTRDKFDIWKVEAGADPVRTGTNLFRVSDATSFFASGNVGIRTSEPQSALDVRGHTFVGSADPNKRIKFTDGWTTYPDTTNGAEICNETEGYKSLMIVGNKSAGDVRKVSLWDDVSVARNLDVSGRIGVDSNVGIGTKEPQAKLDVRGGNTWLENTTVVNKNSATGGGIQISDDGGFYDDNDGWIRFDDRNGGNDTKGLDIKGMIQSHGAIQATSNYPQLKLWDTDNTDKFAIIADINQLQFHCWDGNGNYINQFATMGRGLDYAEAFDTLEDEITPGTVMIIDPDSGTLTISREAYDRKVVGVIAGAKGLMSGVTLGTVEQGKGKHSVAIAGQVYCNVDSQYGDIKPGDLLTTSPTPGYAMKATDFSKAFGAVLGKAMEKLSGGAKG